MLALLRRLDRIVYRQIIWWYFLGGRRRAIARDRNYERNPLGVCTCDSDGSGHRGMCQWWKTLNDPDKPWQGTPAAAITVPKGSYVFPTDSITEHQSNLITDLILRGQVGEKITDYDTGITYIREPDGQVHRYTKQFMKDYQRNMAAAQQRLQQLQMRKSQIQTQIQRWQKAQMH
jgi:hypothetical protein